MKFLYRIVILAIVVLLCFYLVKYPITTKVEDILCNIEDPVRDQYAIQQGIARFYLSEERQLIYDAMYLAISEGSERVTLPVDGYIDNDVEVVLISILNDCPQFFYVDYSDCSYAIDDRGLTILISYLYSGAELERMQKELNSRIKSLVDATVVLGLSSEYQKAVYLHDAIAEMCEYDKSLNGKNIHNAYGALVSQLAVCDGYAHAYQLVLEELGIECHYVTGEARGPHGAEGHAWNIVKLDGVYTTIDLTWNDIDSYMFEEFIAPSKDITSHIYFGISEDEMKQTHRIDEKYIYPLPIAEDRNWFSYYGLVGLSIEEISDRASDMLLENIGRTVPYVEIRLLDHETFFDFLEVYSGEIIERANEKLEMLGVEYRVKNEMNCFVTSLDKGCILVVVELEEIEIDVDVI